MQTFKKHIRHRESQTERDRERESLGLLSKKRGWKIKMFNGTLRALLCSLHPHEKTRLNSPVENTPSLFMVQRMGDFSVLTGLLMVLVSFQRKEQPPEHELHSEAPQTLTH